MQSLTAKVADLKERVQTIGQHEEIALLRTALFLGEEMLVRRSRFNLLIVYQKNVSFKKRKSGCPAITWVLSIFICWKRVW